MSNALRGPGRGLGSKRSLAMLKTAQNQGLSKTPRSTLKPPIQTFHSRGKKRKRNSLDPDDDDAEEFHSPLARQKCITPVESSRLVTYPHVPSSSAPLQSTTVATPLVVTGQKSILPHSMDYTSRPGFTSGPIKGLISTAPTQVGLINLGNTCYLNAVLQSLFALPSFSTAARAAAASCGKFLPHDGVLTALLHCLESRAAASSRLNRANRCISPEEVQVAVARRKAIFGGPFQQDAHEFFLALLQGAQEEVFAADVARLGRPKVRVSETADLVTRTFGFAVEQETTCSACGAESRIVEQGTHLSLDIPESSERELVPLGVDAMLDAFFREESVNKQCEKCHMDDVEHTVRRKIKRMPRVLALHLKRFKVNLSDVQRHDPRVTCTKVSTRVTIPTTVRLRQFCVAKPTPTLALAPATDTALFPNTTTVSTAGLEGKENAQPIISNAPPVNVFHRQGCDNEQMPAAPAARRACAFYSGADAAMPSFWDDSSLANRRKGATWLSGIESIIAGAKNPNSVLDSCAATTSFNETEIAAAMAASTRDAALKEAETEEDVALATAIKRSLEDQSDAMKHEDQSDAMKHEARALDGPFPSPMQTLYKTPADHRQSRGGESPPTTRGIVPELVEDDVKELPPLPNFPKERELSPQAETEPPPPQISLGHFRVQAVICHHGARVDRGHFTADARDATTGQWHRYDDEEVHRIPATSAMSDLQQRGCYLMFYAPGK